MPLLKTAAVVLQSQKWGEADRIITCFSLNRGKIRAIARGARRLKSSFGGAIEPFVYSEYDLFEKRGDSLFRINHVDILEAFPRVREDLERINAASRIANLARAMTADGDSDPAIFDTLVQGFRELEAGEDPSLVTLLFRIRLLGQTGFRPQTDHCVICGATEHFAKALFSPRSGGLICRPCAGKQQAGCLFLSQGGWAFLAKASQMSHTLLTRLKTGRGVQKELETAIDAFVSCIPGVRLPAVHSFAVEGPPIRYGLKQNPNIRMKK